MSHQNPHIEGEAHKCKGVFKGISLKYMVLFRHLDFTHRHRRDPLRKIKEIRLADFIKGGCVGKKMARFFEL